MNVYVEVKATGEWRWCHESSDGVAYSSGASTSLVEELAERVLIAALMGTDTECKLYIDRGSVLHRVIAESQSAPDEHASLVQLMDEKCVWLLYDSRVKRTLDLALS